MSAGSSSVRVGGSPWRSTQACPAWIASSFVHAWSRPFAPSKAIAVLLESLTSSGGASGR